MKCVRKLKTTRTTRRACANSQALAIISSGNNKRIATLMSHPFPHIRSPDCECVENREYGRLRRWIHASDGLAQGQKDNNNSRAAVPGC